MTAFDRPPWENPANDEAAFLLRWATEYDEANGYAAEPAVVAPSSNGNGAKPVEPPADELPPVNVPLDWEAEFNHDYSVVDWLPGKLCERGQQVAFVGGGKVGKSLFFFEWCWRAVTGQDFLFHTDCTPLTIVYCDRENSRRDLVMRARALGATPGQLIKFVYYSFPQIPHLDQNGTAVLDFVEQAGADVVILDTVSRFVSGKENDAETWLGLYRSVHARLKARNKTGIRLDHFGKDTDRGSRGSSAKDQDVDVVWEMSAHPDDEMSDGSVSTELRLARTHTRTGIGPSMIDIVRRGQKDLDTDLWVPGATSHRLIEHDTDLVSVRLREVIDSFDAAGIDALAGRKVLINESANKGFGFRLSTADWCLVAKTRKEAEFHRRQAMRPPPSGPPQDPIPDV